MAKCCRSVATIRIGRGVLTFLIPRIPNYTCTWTFVSAMFVLSAFQKMFLFPELVFTINARLPQKYFFPRLRKLSFYLGPLKLKYIAC